MALVLGTNCGFCVTAPVDDPTGTAWTSKDNSSWVGQYTSPATAIKITEIGWYCDNATEEANFQVGLYAADGAVVPGEAGTNLYLSSVTAKGTTAGWKKVTGLSWDITSNTNYWLAGSLTNTATATTINQETSGGQGIDARTGVDSLPYPTFSGGALYDTNGLLGIYAVWSAGAAAATASVQLNIGDAWKDASGAIMINIGDAWKNVTNTQINIGDAWKTIF